MMLNHVSNRTYGILAIIFFVALVPRVAWFLCLSNNENGGKLILGNDAAMYHKLAVNLLEHQAFSASSHRLEPNTMRAPGYPLFLAANYAMFGVDPFVAIPLQIVISCLTSLVIYRTGRLFGEAGRKVGFIAGLIFALDYSSVANANALLSETVFLLLFSILVWLFAKFLLEHKQCDLITSAIVLGLATLCRPVTVYLPVVLFGMFIPHIRKNVRSGLFKYATFIAAYLITVLPWMTRNYTVSGRFLLTSQQESVLLWNRPHAANVIRDSETNRNGSYQPSSAARAQIAQAVWDDLRKYSTGAVRFFMTPGSSKLLNVLGLSTNEFDDQDSSQGLRHMTQKVLRHRGYVGMILVSFLICYLLFVYGTACIGVCVAFRGGHAMLVCLFLTICVYFLAASVSFTFTERYRLPIMPYVILLSSYAIVYLTNRRPPTGSVNVDRNSRGGPEGDRLADTLADSHDTRRPRNTATN